MIKCRHINVDYRLASGLWPCWLAARRSRRNERFLVGMAFVDVSRVEIEIANEEAQRGEMEMSVAAGDGRCREDNPSGELVSSTVWAIAGTVQ